MKSDLTARVYVDATDELPDIRDVVRFAKANGILLAYPYLGDIGESVTGDKKAQAFEDAYLDRLLPLLVDLGFEVITFMPSRNTAEQLDRLMALAKKYDLFQVSGEDINPVSYTHLDVYKRQLLGSYASEIILSPGIFIEAEMTVDDIKEVIFAHPTVSEVIREAIFQLD